MPVATVPESKGAGLVDHGMWNKRLNRRAVLGTIAGGAAAAILAACGGSKATDTPQPAGTTATTAAGNATSPTTAAGAHRPSPARQRARPPAARPPLVAPSHPPARRRRAPRRPGRRRALQRIRRKARNRRTSPPRRRCASSPPGDPKTLDPAVGQYAADIGFIHLLYDALFSFDDKGNLVPRAAAAVPTQQNGGISSDGLTYTVKLRPGQKYSDGSPVAGEGLRLRHQAVHQPADGIELRLVRVGHRRVQGTVCRHEERDARPQQASSRS